MDLTTLPEYISATAAINALLFADFPHDEILAYLENKFDAHIAMIVYKENIENYMEGN
jgi:hypothetical protein